MKKLVLLLCLIASPAFAGYPEQQAQNLAELKESLLKLVELGQFQGDAKGCAAHVGIFNSIRVNSVRTCEAMHRNPAPILAVAPLEASSLCN